VEQANSVVQAQLSSLEDELTKLRNQVREILEILYIHIIQPVQYSDTLGYSGETVKRRHQAR